MNLSWLSRWWSSLTVAALLVGLSSQRLGGQTFVSFDASGNMTALAPIALSSPAIISGPASRTMPPGTAGSLTVNVSGVPPFSFQWFLNGASVPGSNSDTLLLTNISALNAGNYRVVVANHFGSVTSVVARLDIDTDRDNLGDAWEMTYFGSLTNQNATQDKDADGTMNLVEFQDGTNPTNRNSLLPRLTLYPVGGTVILSPDLAAYHSNDLVTLTAIPDPGLTFISWIGDLVGATNPATLRMTINRLVQANFGLPLSLALNTTNPVITGGRGGWIGQTNVTRDGQAAASVAPPLAGTGDPFIEATVNLQRDGTASFWWRIDGEQNNTLTLSVDGSSDFWSTRTLEGVSGWQFKTIFLAAGPHKLRWTYSRSGGGWTEGDAQPKPRDSAYLDQLVLTEYANPLLDADANGLPDLWEYRYFDRLGNNPNADADGDGVPNLVELTDGTDPSSKSSVRPRLSYLIEGQGTAATSSSLVTNVYTYGQWVTNTATPDSGWRFVAWVGPFGAALFPRLDTNNPSRERLYQSETFKAIFGLPLSLALDAPELTWNTSSNFAWYGQSIVTHDGAHAAQSAVNADKWVQSDSWLETTVAGPGTLSFFWKVSSATNTDYLTFLVNSNEMVRLTGNLDWQPVSIPLANGPQTLRWLFKRNYGNDTNALDAAWLDQVRYTPGVSGPEFTDLPASLLSFQTSNLTFQAAARGTPPIFYQVWRQGVALTQLATNKLITISNVTPALSGNWIIRAQNTASYTDSQPIPVTILASAPNDLFANATVLSEPAPTFAGYTFGATREPNEPSHSSFSPKASVWHRWTAPADGLIRVIATATNVPTSLILAAYQGSVLKNLIEVAANDAYAVLTNGVRVAQVEITWRALAGTTYSLVVDTGQGSGVFYHLVFSSLPPPINDAFANRLPLEGSFIRVTGDNSTASAEPSEPPVFSIPPFYSVGASNTLWWTWTPPLSGRLLLIHVPDAITPLLSVFTGDNLSTLRRITNSMNTVDLSLDVTQGIPYAISADSENGQAGHFTFLLTLDAATLEILRPAGNNPGMLTLAGPPNRPVIVQFSPNLQDWYFWSSNTVSYEGVLQISLDPPKYLDQTLISDPWQELTISIPPAAHRFFRAVSP